MKIVISMRLDKNHLAYLYDTLLSQGYLPDNLTDIIRMSTVDWLKNINPNIIHKVPSNTSLNAIDKMKSNKKSFTELFKLDKIIQTTTIPQKPIIDTSILTYLPQSQHEKATMIIAAINAGISISQQLNNDDKEIVAITKLICNYLPGDTLTAKEKQLLNEV